MKIQKLTSPNDIDFIEDFSSLRERICDKKYLIGGPGKDQTKQLMMWGLLHKAVFILVKDDENKTVLRLALRILPHMSSMGVIGLFELDLKSSQHIEAFKLAMAESEAYFKENNIREIAAPVDLTTWFSYRFSEYDKKAWPRFNWEPTTPPEYQKIFREAGYQDFAYYHSVFFPYLSICGYHLGSGPLRKSYKNISTQGFKIVPFDLSKIKEELPTLHEIVHDAFDGSFMFEPIDVQTFGGLYGGALTHYDFSPSAKLISPEGKVAGFIFAFYDGNYLIVKSLAIKKEYQGLKLSSGLVYHCCKHSFPNKKIKGTISALVKSGIASESIEKNVNKTLLFSWSHKYVLLKKDL